MKQKQAVQQFHNKGSKTKVVQQFDNKGSKTKAVQQAATVCHQIKKCYPFKEATPDALLMFQLLQYCTSPGSQDDEHRTSIQMCLNKTTSR